MPTVDERLKQVTSKIERAKRHIDELEAEIRTFLDSQPYGVAAKRDPDTRRIVYYVTSAKPVPACLPLIAGDVIQCLMSALDHLAYQLVCSDTGDNPPNPNWIYFPIQDDATKYEAKKRGKIEGASQETIDAIDEIRPYKGGNDLIWMLYRLNNIEKHRTLFTVGSQAAGVGLSHMAARTVQSMPSRSDDPGFVRMQEAMILALESDPAFTSLFLMPADTGFPLKEGFVLFRDAEDAEPNPKQQFRFAIALHEPGVAEGRPLLETLHELTRLVEGIVTALTPRLK